MNEAVIPAVVAAGGGSALAAAIYLHERRRELDMRASREPLRLRFPAGLDADAAKVALSSLSGLPDLTELVAETVATANGIHHGLLVPSAVTGSVTSTLTQLLPGLRMSPATALTGSSILCLRLYVPTPILLRTDEAESASRALLAGLSQLHEHEVVAIRWATRTTTAYRRQPVQPQTSHQRQVERDWQRKTDGPGFLASGLVLIQCAPIARARELADHITGIYRSRRGATEGLRVTSERSGRTMAALPQTNRRSGWISTAEALPLLAWPIGEAIYPNLEVGSAREIPVPGSVLRAGRRLLIGRDYAGKERPVAISAVPATQHQVVIGPSGVGKTTLLATNILSDLAHGHGGVVIDPKSDMVHDVADRVPERDAHRVVILDPATGGAIPGVNLLAGADPDLTTDVILGALAAIYPDSWGIRSSHYGRMAVRTLAGMPAARLTDVGRLFGDPSFRAAAVGRLSDPLLRDAWDQYEQLSAVDAATRTEPFLTKALTLFSRPAVRAVLASPDPKLDIARLLEERRLLLIDLSPGRLGEPASKLLGSVLQYLIWNAIEGRATLPQERRRPVYIYLDELASLADLPFGFELLAERSRGLGAGLVVAMQTISRLPDGVRRSLLGNARR